MKRIKIVTGVLALLVAVVIVLIPSSDVAAAEAAVLEPVERVAEFVTVRDDAMCVAPAASATVGMPIGPGLTDRQTYPYCHPALYCTSIVSLGANGELVRHRLCVPICITVFVGP